MTLLTGWPLEINVDDVLRGQAMDPQVVRASKPTFLKAAESILEDGMSLLQPTALLREVGVREHRHNRILLEGGTVLTGSLAASHLASAQRIFAVICTIGAELETTVSRMLADSFLFALALDGLGNAAVEELSHQICAHIGEQIIGTGLSASTPLSPGSPDWPVEVGQPEIFYLLNPSTAGVTLTSGGMMVPKKSMSFVVGIGQDMSHANLCVICSLRETCRYQHEH